MLNQGYNIMADTGRHVKSIQFLPSPTFSASKQEYGKFLNQLSKLPMICPNITSLRIPDHVFLWKHKDNESSLTDNLRILLVYAPVLTNLELIFYGPTWPCLTHLHRLQHIKLACPDGTLCLERLEEIHQQCSLLENLDISVLQFDTSSITPNLQTPVAAKLTGFTLKSQHFISSMEPIFIYASRKYPQLEYLGIQSASPISTKTDLQKEEEEELDIGTTLLNRYSAYASLVRGCPHVSSLALGNMLSDQALLDALSTSGCNIPRHMSSYVKVMFDNSVFDYLACRCPRLTQLTILNSICCSSNTFVRIHMSLSRLGQVKMDRLFSGRYSRKSEEQITRAAISTIQQKPTELQCQRPDFDADITRWYQAGKSLIEFCGQLSICC